MTHPTGKAQKSKEMQQKKKKKKKSAQSGVPKSHTEHGALPSFPSWHCFGGFSSQRDEERRAGITSGWSKTSGGV